jgi:hypothetical protein
MSSRFAQQFKQAGAPGLVRQFGELVVYYPRGSTDNARQIYAIVERSEEAIENAVVQAIRCRVLNDQASGILSTEINDGRDEIAVALIQDGPLERREITKMEDDSNGMVRFKVR